MSREKVLAGLERYLEDWGNYKSDKHKSRRTLGAEISDIMVQGTFTKKELIEIRDFILPKAFKGMI